jgi:hypothetical protein
VAVTDTVAMQEGRKLGRDKYLILETREGIAYFNLHEFPIFHGLISFITVTSTVSCKIYSKATK